MKATRMEEMKERVFTVSFRKACRREKARKTKGREIDAEKNRWHDKALILQIH